MCKTILFIISLKRSFDYNLFILIKFKYNTQAILSSIRQKD
ncbi:hypothetical protein SMGD1_2540 [Sulfurimonas gotlandica GD1]|uniref:Uncharacterized protein n=1 Tax=Sulfurimonas gotlandica (strain DSM 19862 / JCM 16533 / GD1) TaxID=929558 RepID=B6BNJ0_SULGG|nr:hypothetical protein CBGD1_2404 [Sulfurimonas gotlandica GD1]EHP31062.1 hypothetical protein SMGD1_2540 [Sulfurimonas gotlandica GD1]